MTNEPFGQVQALEAAIKRLAAIVDDLVTAGEAAEGLLDALFSFYGTGLEVANWHLNGDLEPWDKFYNANSTGEELNDLRAAIARARKHPFDSSHLAWCNHPPATSMDYCWSYADHVDGNPKFADLEKICFACDFRKEPPAEAAKK